MNKILDGSGGRALVRNFANYVDARSTAKQHVEFYLQHITGNKPTCLTVTVTHQSNDQPSPESNNQSSQQCIHH